MTFDTLGWNRACFGQPEQAKNAVLDQKKVKKKEKEEIFEN